MAVPKRFRPIVGGASGAAGALGVPGAFAFGADVPFLNTIWGVGAAMISEEAGHKTDAELMKGLATTTLSGVAGFLAGSKLASSLFNLLPGPGTLAAIGVNSFLNTFFTYRFLRSVSKVYDKFDDEEIIWQSLKSGVSFFSLWGIASDISDMLECISESGELINYFKNL